MILTVTKFVLWSLFKTKPLQAERIKQMFDIAMEIIFRNFRIYNSNLKAQGKRGILFNKYIQLFY